MPPKQTCKQNHNIMEPSIMTPRKPKPLFFYTNFVLNFIMNKN